ncbi:hypothetical protein M514_01678 [Trichuris suis]|uniref:Uncharacterized protein n=1 Tax=Trichuris suis TaxID=68888 RepID=A0A085N5W8_9BILA|nr:hypothetical protein M513_01678 [Trichuris suis]KFD64864.1 hypothetical protein M514_01678 [Trichuris suis]
MTLAGAKDEFGKTIPNFYRIKRETIRPGSTLRYEAASGRRRVATCHNSTSSNRHAYQMLKIGNHVKHETRQMVAMQAA